MTRLDRFSALCRSLTHFTMVTVATCLAAASLYAQSAEFLAVERRAQLVLQAMQCATAAGEAAARGRFGALDQTKDIVSCVGAPSEFMGVAFRYGGPSAPILGARVVDLKHDSIVTAPVDTLRLSQEFNAIFRAFAQPVVTGKQRPSSVPIMIRTEGDTIEVWLLPETQFAEGRSWMPESLGGERSVILTPDGERVVRVTDQTETWRGFSPKPSGMVLIDSEVEEIPLLTELLACVQSLSQGRSAAIQTRRWIYVALGNGWVVTKR